MIDRCVKTYDYYRSVDVVSGESEHWVQYNTRRALESLHCWSKEKLWSHALCGTKTPCLWPLARVLASWKYVPTQVTPKPEFDRVVNKHYQELAQTCSRTSNQRVLMFLNKLLYYFTYINYWTNSNANFSK